MKIINHTAYIVLTLYAASVSNAALAGTTGYDFVNQANSSGGRGTGQGGNPNLGKGTRSVYDWAGFTNADSVGRPTLEAPITQQNNIAGVKGESWQIYDYNQVQAQRANGAGGSGTSFRQSPGYLQSSHTPLMAGSTGVPGVYSFAELPSGAFNYGFSNKGGLNGLTAPYMGVNSNGGYIPLGAGTLPPVSLGSMDFNIVDNARLYTQPEVNSPTSFSR